MQHILDCPRFGFYFLHVLSLDESCCEGCFENLFLKLFEFDYKIEIYVPAEKRRFGYYVLPFLMNDKIVGRVDLKTHRKDNFLEVKAAFAEPQTDHSRVAHALHCELQQLARLVSVDELKFGRKGNLMRALRSAAK